MNTINRIDINIDENTFENFRRKQYEMIPDFVELAVNFISKQNKNYLQLDSISFEDKISYKDVYNSELKILECKIKDLEDPSKPKQLFKVFVPKLINDNYFFLNGNFYVPTVYLLDKPITVKKKSIIVSTLFNSMTFNFKRNVVTYTGVNIPIHLYILLLYYYDTSLENDIEDFQKLIQEKITKKFVIKYESDENIIEYFSKNLNCDKTLESIIEYFNQTMFDDYTTYLFQQCYNLNEVNVISVFKKLIDILRICDQISFVDLTYKRLVFTELLIQPIMKAASRMVLQAIRGFKPDELKINLFEITKKFNTYLKSNYLYDTANLYSCLLQHKISMLNPGSERGPRSISSIHQSHFGKICPVTVSSQDPGKTVSIVPGTKVDLIGQIREES